MIMVAENDRYRECVGVMLMSKDSKVFVGRRIDTDSDYWQMPQGGVEEGEEYVSAMRRELFEETNITNIRIVKEMDHWLYYDIPLELRENFWGGAYIGQKQKWFQCLFCGFREEINIATATPEFRSWKWQDRDKVVAGAIPFKRELYQNVLDYFGNG